MIRGEEPNSPTTHSPPGNGKEDPLSLVYLRLSPRNFSLPSAQTKIDFITGRYEAVHRRPLWWRLCVCIQRYNTDTVNFLFYFILVSYLKAKQVQYEKRLLFHGFPK